MHAPRAGRAAGRWLATLLLTTVLVACGRDSPERLLASGKSYFDRGDFKSAAIELKSALRLDAQAVEARVLLGRALAAAGDGANAAIELEKALAQGASRAAVLPELARALQIAGQDKRLVHSFAELKLDEPVAQAALATTVASAWLRLGDADKARAALAPVLQAQPGFAPALVLQARLLAAAGKLDEALAVVDRAIAGTGEGVAEAWAMKGDFGSARRGSAGEVEAAYREALEHEPRLARGHAGLVAVHLRAGKLDQAEQQAAVLRGHWPAHPMTAFIDAQIAYQRRDLPRARERTQALLKVVPDEVGVLQLAGAIESELGSIFTAETHFARALQLAPDLPHARRALARVHNRQGQAGRALTVLAPLIGPGSNDAEALTLAGEAQLKRDNPLEAEALFQRAAGMAPDNESVLTLLALSQLARGQADAGFALLEDVARKGKALIAEQALVSARLKRQEFDAALAAVEEMERKSARTAATVELRGRIELARPDFAAARAAFEEALRLDTSLFAATANLAAIDIGENKLDAAQARLQASIAADPRNHLALLALADLAERRGLPVAEAQGLLQRAVQAAPDLAEPHVRRMDFLIRKRLFKDTLAAAQEAAAALPNDLGVLDVIGRAQMAAGDIEQAFKSFRRLASANDRSPVPHLRLAELHRASNQREQAEAALKKALELDPENVSAQASLFALLTMSGRAEDALAFAQGLQRRSPTLAGGYLAEGAFHMHMKAPDKALLAYRRGMAETKAPVLTRVAYDLLLQQRRRDEARALITAWERDRVYDPAGDQQLALIEIRHRELPWAEQRLARVVKVQPKNLVANNNLAWLMTQRGHPGAVAVARRAAELAPNNPAVLDTLAGALAASRAFGEALWVQRRALELSPGSHDLRLSYASLAVKAGRQDVARAEVARLRALGAAYGRQADVEKLSRDL